MLSDYFFFFSSRRRHTRLTCDWSSDVCSSDLLPLEESEALLDALWAHATQPRFAFCQRWQVGDLMIWDNRCTLHRRDPFDPNARRVMHRTQIKGDRPYL